MVDRLPGKKETEKLTAHTTGLDRGGATRRLELEHAAKHVSKKEGPQPSAEGRPNKFPLALAILGCWPPGQK